MPWGDTQHLSHHIHLAVLLASSLLATSLPSVPHLSQSYNVSIYENSVARSYVLGSDLMGVPISDLHYGSSLTYHIIEGNVDGFFVAETEIVGGLAVLRLRTRTGQRDVLNRERRAFYILVVEARLDSSSAFTTNITVDVLDTNDNIPLFYPTSYQMSVGEDAGLHTPLLAVTAHDADSGQNGEVYFFLQNHDTNLFSIHPTSGVLSVTRPLSFNSQRKHKVTVLARDRGIQPHSPRSARLAQVTVEIDILEVNHHSPHINIQSLPTLIEHSHTHIYAIITVDDPDNGDNGLVREVKIINGDKDSLFSILPGSEPREFKLIALKMRDREVTDGYNLTILAVDSGTPRRSSSTSILIKARGLTRQAPLFVQEQYEESVNEEAPPGTPVVRVASGTDEGFTGQVLFRLVAGNDDHRFEINPATGTIFTIGWLDHEITAYYSLTVAAVDQTTAAQRKQSSAKVIIRVLDANDNAPEFRTPNTEVTLDENEPIGAYVTRMLATDADSGENGFISYSIANLDQVPFVIDPFDGTVRTSSVLDFEAQRRIYTIKVRASDWGTPFKRETETTIKVKVRDINDNRPQFKGVDCKGWVDVNAPVGTSVITLSAVDLDNGTTVTYKLHNDMAEGCWAIDSSTGILALTCELRSAVRSDKEKVYVLNVTASDGTHASDPTSVTIMVVNRHTEGEITLQQNAHIECHSTKIDSKAAEVVAAAAENNAAVEHYALLPLRYGINSHAPEIPESFPAKIRVLENIKLGTTLLTVKAEDHDRGYNGRMVYTLSHGNIDSVFKIGLESGVIEIVGELDRERRSEYILNLTVYDLGQPPRSVSSNFTVAVIDVNDNAPIFKQPNYNIDLPENINNGTSVAQVTAVDKDEGLNAKVTYELVSDVDEFTVDRNTGIIVVAKSLDRERREIYDLRIRAWDSDPENPLSSLSRVLIKVLDINDCSPSFGISSDLKINIPEDLPLGAIVATVQATDDDLGPGGRVTYSLRGQDDAFRVDTETGVIRLAGELDFETRYSYNVTVRAKDSGSPSLESYTSLFIRIHDVDENVGPPIFPERIVRAWIKENLDPGAHVANLTARDPDGKRLHYAITGGNGLGLFAVDSKGVVRSLVVLDREVIRGYWITVVVADEGTPPLTDTCHVWIEIEDMNDYVPQTEDPAYHIRLTENLPPDTIVLSLNTQDPDVTPVHLSYTFTRGNHLNHFTINPSSGEIRTAVTLDRESKDRYELWVMVSDGQLSSTTPIYISLLDTNDNPPIFPDVLYRVTIPAGRKTSRREALFRTGLVYFIPKGEPVDEGGDSWGPWQSFLPTDITPRDQALFRVYASDADTGMNGELTYSIKTGDGRKKRFKIHPKTGQIYTTEPLTSGKTFDLMVRARDRGRPQMTGSTRVLMRAVQIPHSSPTPPIITPSPPAHLTDTDLPGHVVTFISAHDPDNDTLWYHITDGDDEGRFSIGVDSGVVTLARRLPRLQIQYSLTITATDGIHTASTKVLVTVVTVGGAEGRPVFSAPVYEASVREDTPPDSSVLSVKCNSATHSTLYYTLHHTHSLGSATLFAIESATGVVKIVKPLDREVSGVHELTVSCGTEGRREVADFSRVKIRVIDTNDHDPTFLESMFSIKVSVGTISGTKVGQVFAVDHDKGDSGRLSYSIVEGNIGGLFRIDERLGIITLTHDLMSPKPHEYLLLVRATDHASVPRAASVPVSVQVTSWHLAPPTWTHPPQVVEVSEWAEVGSAVSHLSAHSTSPLHYTITQGDDDAMFTISPVSGVLSLARILNYEECSWYNLSIMAATMEGEHRTTWLGINVLDENNWWPEWAMLKYQGVVWETAHNNAPVLAAHTPTPFTRRTPRPHLHSPTPLTLTAYDRDRGENGRVKYSIVEKNVGKFFKIDQFTGAVRVSGSLKVLAGRTVTFNVWASDGGAPMRECVAPATVIVNIKTVKPTLQAFTESHFKTSLFTPTFQGVSVLCPAKTASNRNQPKFSIIKGDEKQRFTFEDTCLKVRDPTDLKPLYNLTLEAKDGSSTSMAIAEIRVQEAPLSTLTFTQDRYRATVLENSTKEINVVAIALKASPLNQHVHFSILNPSDKFDIHPTAGIIKTTGVPFDRERKDHYSLIVQVQEAEKGISQNGISRVHVDVEVADINDNEPVFLNQPYIAIVTTNTPRAQVVAKVRALDLDVGDFGSVRYELVRGSGELFSVKKNTGEIFLKQSMMVVNRTYSLTVAAYDGGKPPLSSQAHVRIRVVSSNGPLFSSARYEASVAEDSPKGSPVIRVDAASSGDQPVIYTIVNNDLDQFFSVDFTTGVVKIDLVLDYETTKSHNITVRARDPSTGKSTDAQVNINVVDINDNSPEFTQHVFRGEVSEAATMGQAILQVSATDKDTGLGGQVQFSCEENCEPFEIGGNGEIRVAGKIDAETEPQLSLVVVATDSGHPRLSSTSSVVINVLDFNDNPPVWRQDSYSCRVSPEAQPGHILATMSALDPDAGQVMPLIYNIHSGDSQDIFEVNSLTGVVTVTAPYKLGNITSLNLNMSVSDGVHMAFTDLHVAVLPSYQHAPRFRKQQYDAEVEENSEPGQLVLNLGSQDLHTHGYTALTYQILYQSSETAFSIDKEGNLYTATPLDREATQLHNLKVLATDEGGHSSFVEIRVTVIDMNDNAPIFMLREYQSNINSNSAPGTIILKVEASDMDIGVNSEIEYFIYDARNSEAMTMFKVDPSNGQVTLARSTNGLENQVYQFFIRAEDHGSPRHHSDIPVKVLVLPSSILPPKCSTQYAQFFIREDAAIGTQVTKLWLSGPQHVEYQIQCDDRGSEEAGEAPFAVTPGGAVVVNRPLDHERRSLHHITVTNKTLTKPPLLDYMTLSIVVVDVNDCAPHFSESTYKAEVVENSGLGSTVTVLTATDKDEGTNGQVQYKLAGDLNSTISSIFRLDPHTGVLTLASPLDREAVPSYTFTVVASDGGSDPLSTRAKVEIEVRDYNDNPPIFIKDSYVTAVPEDTSIGTAVVELNVSDLDKSVGQLNYFVTSGDTQGHFLVHTSGQVYVASELDREQQAEYVLTVTATDGKFTANTSVTVTVIDVNDNGPVCQEPYYKREVFEGGSGGTHIVSVMAWDPDEGSWSRSRYSVEGEMSHHFAIDQLNGHVTTAVPLDRETRDRYLITVVVRDWEVAAWRCMVTVEIIVRDINDNPPMFPEALQTATLPEDAPINTIVSKIVATDPDLGMNRRVKYKMVDSASGHFRIDDTEGIVSLARPLDRENRDTYNITVIAVDRGTPSLSATAQLTITVSDINDNPPEFVRNLHETGVVENAAVGTEVVRVLAVSKDVGVNAQITYSLQHTTREKYLHIHPSTGVISVGSTLDYEQVRQVVATVVATDGGSPPLSATALVNITITDVNDNSPVFSQLAYSAAVREDALQGISITKVTATDDDSGANSVVRYSILSGNDDHSFSIHEDSGIVTLMKKLDREKTGAYELRIGGRDLGIPSNTAVAMLHITVSDVNDNPPVFAQDNYTVIIQENRMRGSVLVRLVATDADSEENGGPFTWDLLTQGDHTLFTLGQDGSLKLNTDDLDHTVQDKYSVHVRVWDNGTPQLYANTQVIIKVVEESRYPPTLYPLTARVISYAQSYSPGIVGKVIGVDEDPYDSLQYSISPHPDKEVSIKYFDINDDGMLSSLIPLDSGPYSINVSVSDGRYHRAVQVMVIISVITREIIRNSVIVRLGPLTTDEFLAKYYDLFRDVVASEFSTERESVILISFQPSKLRKPDNPKNRKINPKFISDSLDILLAVKNTDTLVMRKELVRKFKTKENTIRKGLQLQFLHVIDSVCTSKINCSGHGMCSENVNILKGKNVTYSSEIHSVIAPKFSVDQKCNCKLGYGGEKCEVELSVCGRRPCAEYEECVPQNNTLGYSCQCPKGRVGSGCKVDLQECHDPTCHYPKNPISFSGQSYLQYSIDLEGSSVQITTFIRTTYPSGTIFYAGGRIDYSILEITGGKPQFRWDCGNGEGRVRAPLRVDDNKWHFLNLTRSGTVSTLTIDGESNSGASPGISDVVNMGSNPLYLGAQIDSWKNKSATTFAHRGYVGCLDQFSIDGVTLPVTKSGKILRHLENIHLDCPSTLPPAGICGSYPCLNGGTCTEKARENGLSYNCSCLPRFSGSRCQVDTDPCASSPCLNGGTCTVVNNSFKCKCPLKLSGNSCEYGVFCTPNPCKNEGQCEEGAEGPLCKCPHFSGPLCETDLDECTLNPCHNGGSCINLNGGFKCICFSNVTGEHCSEAFYKPPEQPRTALMSLGEVLCLLAVLLGCIIAVLVLVLWQRRRCKAKRHQHNSMGYSDHQLKNDLKAEEELKRNSKICNVEAEQGPPLPPRPSSYTPTGTESVLINTLKHLADLSAAGHESLELGTLSHELLHSLNKPPVPTSTISPTLHARSDPDLPRKPWDHHNNLNQSYVTTFKGCHVDQWDVPRCQAVVPCGDAVVVTATPDLLLLPKQEQPTLTTFGHTTNSARFSRGKGQGSSAYGSYENTVTALVSTDARDSQELADEEDEDEDEDDEPCSFQENYVAKGLCTHGVHKDGDLGPLDISPDVTSIDATGRVIFLAAVEEEDSSRTDTSRTNSCRTSRNASPISTVYTGGIPQGGTALGATSICTGGSFCTGETDQYTGQDPQNKHASARLIQTSLSEVYL